MLDGDAAPGKGKFPAGPGSALAGAEHKYLEKGPACFQSFSPARPEARRTLIREHALDPGL